MPTILTLPSVPERGLGNLGASILAGVTDLKARQRAAEREDQLRQQFLSDVAEQRAYTEGVRSKQRGEALSDDERRRRQMLSDEVRHRDDGLKDLLIAKFYLRPEQRDQPGAVESAYQAAARDGALERYASEIAGGFLSMSDVENPSAISTAQQKRADEMARESERLRELPTKAQSYVDDLNQQYRELSARQRNIELRRSQLDDILSQDMPEPTPGQVRARAEQMVRSSNQKPSEENFAAAMEGAYTKLREEALIPFSLRQRAAQQQALALANEASSISREMNDARAMINQTLPIFKVVPGALSQPSSLPVQPSAAAPITPVPSGPPSPAAVQAALQGLVAPGTAAPPPAAAQPASSAAPPPTQVNPFLRDVTPPGEVRSPTGALLRTPADTQRARNTQAVRDFATRTGQFLSNLIPQRISQADIGPNGLVTPESSPAMRARTIQQLQARLSAIREPGTELEARLRSELDRLMRLNDQQASSRSQILSQPINTATSFTPSAARVPIPMLAAPGLQ